jgi:hypothetical protein
MIDRAREIVKMMGYESIDETLEAIGAGDLILLKMPSDDREEVVDWLRAQAPHVRDEDERLADLLQDVAEGLELASELERYPADADICDLDLPHGWPSYCERKLPE